MSKRFLFVVIVCVLALIGVYVATSEKDPVDNGNTTSSKLSNNVLGENSKGVTLVEYGDFQCPACGTYHPLVKQLVEKYKSDIQFQFRNFPLQEIHQNARASARAAESASMQGKYWEMHDLLYEQQQSWGSSSTVTEIFEGFAQQIGLDLAKYKSDFASTEVNDIINADVAEGTKQGVGSTPTFYLQGKKIEENPNDLDSFSKLIEDAIKATENK